MDAKMKKIVVAGSIIGALAIVTAAFVIRSRRRKLEKKILSGSSDVLVPAETTVSSVIFPLKKGAGYGSGNTAENDAVKVVQRYINAKTAEGLSGALILVEDGDFGPLTESALYKLAGVREVSYSFYKEMREYLYKVPEYLSKDAPSYGTTDPVIEKNSLKSLDMIF
jgi:hypothetical protein